MKCRRCKQAEGTIFVDPNGTPTKTAVCRECYEASVRAAYKWHAHGHLRQARDPYHELLPKEHEDAIEWWDRATRDREYE